MLLKGKQEDKILKCQTGQRTNYT